MIDFALQGRLRFVARQPFNALSIPHLGILTMQSSLAIYLPLLTSIISLVTAVAVAFIGFGFSRSTEAGKVRASYLNYALQKLMDEYTKYDPVIDLSEVKDNNYVRLIENRFNECRASIMRVSPLISSASLEILRNMEMKYSDIIRLQHESKLSGIKPDRISDAEYAQLLTNYINLGHELLRMKVETLRLRLEKGDLKTVQNS